MKYIGAGLIWASFLMTGLSFSERFEKRYIIFEELLLMTEEITNGICYLLLPLDEMLIGISGNGMCKNLTFLDSFKKLTYSGVDFPEAWRQSVFSCRLPLSKVERDKIVNFGLSLGRSDSESHKSLVKLYSLQFNTYADEAYAMKKKYSFTSVVTGLLCGGAVFILLI